MTQYDPKKDTFDNVSAVKEEEVTPQDLLRFAKLILAVIAVLFTLGAISEMIVPDSGIFETCKTVLPPIATLVIGFYFAKTK